MPIIGKESKGLGTFGLFVYRAWGQNSLQATVERPPGGERPLPVPRSGTSAPIGGPTIAQAGGRRKR